MRSAKITNNWQSEIRLINSPVEVFQASSSPDTHCSEISPYWFWARVSQIFNFASFFDAFVCACLFVGLPKALSTEMRGEEKRGSAEARWKEEEEVGEASLESSDLQLSKV